MSTEAWTPVTWIHLDDCPIPTLLALGVISNGCICGNSLRGYAFRLPRPLPADPTEATS